MKTFMPMRGSQTDEKIFYTNPRLDMLKNTTVTRELFNSIIKEIKQKISNLLKTVNPKM